MAEGTKVIVGLHGFSAADVARQNGFVGDDAAWVASLQQGAADQAGNAGASAAAAGVSASAASVSAGAAEAARVVAESAAGGVAADAAAAVTAASDAVAARDEVLSHTMTASPDPNNPDLIIITYPTYAAGPDGTSILIPLEA